MFLQDYIGNTPLVTLQRLGRETGNRISVKLEGNNPAGSVKDRPAFSMIDRAEARGEIHPGDVLVEATSGNTGIALAMVAAMRGYRMILIMPDNMSHERLTTMRAYGAEIILVTQELSDIASFAKNKISGGPVLDDNGFLVGIISEADCMKQISESRYFNQPILDKSVERFMTKNVETIPHDMTIFDAAGIFDRHNRRRLPVMKDGILVGQISRKDIVVAALKLSGANWK